jgi:hypothetical protein
MVLAVLNASASDLHLSDDWILRAHKLAYPASDQRLSAYASQANQVCIEVWERVSRNFWCAQ